MGALDKYLQGQDKLKKISGNLTDRLTSLRTSSLESNRLEEQRNTLESARQNRVANPRESSQGFASILNNGGGPGAAVGFGFTAARADLAELNDSKIEDARFKLAELRADRQDQQALEQNQFNRTLTLGELDLRRQEQQNAANLQLTQFDREDTRFNVQNQREDARFSVLDARNERLDSLQESRFAVADNQFQQSFGLQRDQFEEVRGQNQVTNQRNERLDSQSALNADRNFSESQRQFDVGEQNQNLRTLTRLKTDLELSKIDQTIALSKSIAESSRLADSRELSVDERNIADDAVVALAKSIKSTRDPILGKLVDRDGKEVESTARLDDRVIGRKLLSAEEALVSIASKLVRTEAEEALLDEAIETANSLDPAALKRGIIRGIPTKDVRRISQLADLIAQAKKKTAASDVQGAQLADDQDILQQQIDALRGLIDRTP